MRAEKSIGGKSTSGVLTCKLTRLHLQCRFQVIAPAMLEHPGAWPKPELEV